MRQSARRREARGVAAVGLLVLLLPMPVTALTLEISGDVVAAPGTTASAIEGSEFQAPRPEPSMGPPLLKIWRKPAFQAWDRARSRAPEAGTAREDLLRPPLHPVLGSRLEFCAEFTKPDSLKIQLTGTPKNHRSPPA